MKKYSLFIIPVAILVILVFWYVSWKNNQKEIANNSKQELDINSTIVECRDGRRFSGKDLNNQNINFQLIESRIFYKGEEIERLCNPNLGEYDYEAESSFKIIPTYN